MNLWQGHYGQLEADKAHSTVAGIICPPALVEIGLTVTQNLGKARTLEALVPVWAILN